MADAGESQMSGFDPSTAMLKLPPSHLALIGMAGAFFDAQRKAKGGTGAASAGAEQAVMARAITAFFMG